MNEWSAVFAVVDMDWIEGRRLAVRNSRSGGMDGTSRGFKL